jgi:hypothetical protein
VNLLWSYAVSSLCKVFGDERNEQNEGNLHNYPSWRLRSKMIQRAAETVPVPQPLVDHPAMTVRESEGIPNVIGFAYRDVEGIFRRITGREEAIDVETDGSDTVQIEEMKRFWSESLRSELVPLAHHQLSVY